MQQSPPAKTITVSPIIPNNPTVPIFHRYQRKCFLIDSLLEERQKKLAAAQRGKKEMTKDGEHVREA